MYLTSKSISFFLVILFKNFIISLTRLCLFSSLRFTQIMCVLTDFINSNLSLARETFAQLLVIKKPIRFEITCFSTLNVDFSILACSSSSTISALLLHKGMFRFLNSLSFMLRSTITLSKPSVGSTTSTGSFHFLDTWVE